jgi:hypothetical protein
MSYVPLSDGPNLVGSSSTVYCWQLMPSVGCYGASLAITLPVVCSDAESLFGARTMTLAVKWHSMYMLPVAAASLCSDCWAGTCMLMNHMLHPVGSFVVAVPPCDSLRYNSITYNDRDAGAEALLSLSHTVCLPHVDILVCSAVQR